MSADCGCGAELEAGAARRVVTLVHGTYGRHATWMRQGQPLPDSLSSLDDTVVQRFCWRGRNRHADRTRAADELVAELAEQAARFPDAERHVVAHSHGGNVALYALERGGDATAQVRVTTLGTPFLSMAERRVSRWVLWIAAFGLTVFIGNWVQWVFFVHEYESSPRAGLWFAYYSVAAALAVVAVVLFAMSSWLYRRSTDTGWYQLVRGRTVEYEARSVSSPPVDEDQLFVVRAQGDEAAALLGAGQLASWALRRTLSLAGSRWGKWAVALSVISVAVLPENEWVSWVPVVPLVAIAAAVALLTFAYLPFGVDLLFWTMHAAITVGPSPQGYVAGFQAGDIGGSGLAHSAYHDPAVVDAVVQRVKGLHVF